MKFIGIQLECMLIIVNAWRTRVANENDRGNLIARIVNELCALQVIRLSKASEFKKL